MSKLIYTGKELSQHNPELVDEWDYDKNYPVTPDDVSYGSAEKYWWKCKKCGKSYEASPSNRTYRKTACPYCAANDRGISQKHIGYITAGIGPIHPGSGVHKSLPAVGDLHITGILNASGSFEHFLLQTTRLSFVVQMADTITDGILHTFSPVYERRGLLPDGWFHREERRDLCWAKEESRLAALSIETSSGSIS